MLVLKTSAEALCCARDTQDCEDTLLAGDNISSTPQEWWLLSKDHRGEHGLISQPAPGTVGSTSLPLRKVNRA